MNRRNLDFLTLTAIFLVLAAWLATGWLASPCSGDALPLLAALIVFAVVCRVLSAVNRQMLTGSSLLPPLLYAFLATAHPGSLSISTFHAAVLLLAVSIYYYLSYNACRASMGNLSGMYLALGGASILCPPLLWLAPVFAFTSVTKAEEKVKFWTASVLALIAPLAAFEAILYFIGAEGPFYGSLTAIWHNMLAVRHPSFARPVISLVRIAAIAALTVVTIVKVYAHLNTYKTAQFHACVRMILLTLCLGVLTLLFWGDTATPAGLMFLLPVAPLLGLYVENDRNRTTVRTELAILAFILITERISCFG